MISWHCLYSEPGYELKPDTVFQYSHEKWDLNPVRNESKHSLISPVTILCNAVMRQAFISGLGIYNSKDDRDCFCSYFPMTCLRWADGHSQVLRVRSTWELPSWGSALQFSQPLGSEPWPPKHLVYTETTDPTSGVAVGGHWKDV